MAEFHSGRLQAATAAFWRLLKAFPTEPVYCDRLAQVAERDGNPEEGSRAYDYFLARSPKAVTSRFNHARLYRSRGLNEEALKQYRWCLSDGIQGPEEVYSNIGAILSDLNRPEEAERAFRDALESQPGYVPALYNLALLLEERGDWLAAKACFEDVLQRDPEHGEAAARLVQGEVIDSPQHPALQAVRQLLARPRLASGQHESLYYAMGKGLDDCGEYGAAFSAYRNANKLSLRRVPAYDKKVQEDLMERVLHAPVLTEIEPVSDRALVFICGMFRAGSTLLEQILSGHEMLQSGGEIGFMSVHSRLPEWTGAQFAADWQRLGQGYLGHLDSHFPSGCRVLDKRPDNWLLLPMLLRLFPAARFIHSTRQPLDNCLSVYFQQLGSGFSYANSLSDIAHYQQSMQGFMAEVRESQAGRVHSVSYEALVADTRGTLDHVLSFLGLPWDENCINFAGRSTRVRTASVSQVRRSMYSSSVNRWRNYESELQEFADVLGLAR